MPAQFWELCNIESKVILAYLYKQEQGHYPDWDERSGKHIEKQSVTMSPEVEEYHLIGTNKFMSQPPHPGHEKGDK